MGDLTPLRIPIPDSDQIVPLGTPRPWRLPQAWYDLTLPYQTEVRERAGTNPDGFTELTLDDWLIWTLV